MVTSLRLRLTLWYAALLGVILAATATVSYSFHSVSHYDDVDRALASMLIHVRGGMQATGHYSASGNGVLQIPAFEEHASPEVFVRLYDPEGRLIASSRNAGGEPGADPRVVAASAARPDAAPLADRLVRSLVQAAQPSVPIPAEGGFLTAVTQETGERTRFYALPITVDGTLLGYLEAGQSLARLDHSMDGLRNLLTVGSVAGLVASLIGGWLIAASALRPVATIAGTARAIALSRSFSRRLPKLSRRDELGQLAQTFNEMLESLGEAYRSQQRFIADASHELRAPLTSVLGNLELLERAPDLSEAEKEEALRHVRHEAQRMSRLVADLLVLARADAGQALEAEPVDLDGVVADVLGENQARMRGWKLSIGELARTTVRGDRDRLKQLVLVLLDNAIKYTPAGGEIRVGLRARGGLAVLSVADTGIGIGPEDLPHIFERFYRADKARSRDQGGTGLGLSIAKWIAERHGGSIEVRSAPGRGSTFTLRLPLTGA